MTEAQIHRSIIAWLRAVMPDAIVHHSANEGVRGGKAGMLDGARKKGMGQLAGFPDIQVLAGHHIPAMFFEVKSSTGSVSREQAAMIKRLSDLGYRCAVVRSIDDVRARLCEWGGPTKEAGSMVRLPIVGQIS
jgi:hypothetical protein